MSVPSRRINNGRCGVGESGARGAGRFVSNAKGVTGGRRRRRFILDPDEDGVYEALLLGPLEEESSDPIL